MLHKHLTGIQDRLDVTQVVALSYNNPHFRSAQTRTRGDVGLSTLI